LAARLHEDTGCGLARGLRTARKAFRHAFCSQDAAPAWDDWALQLAQIGRWARPTLLALSPKPQLEVAELAGSDDGTLRMLLRAVDGALIESVIIPAEKGRDHARTTLCISSQVGCARLCSFCETGVGGLGRQLSGGEILDQYRIALEICSATDRPLDQRAGPRADDSPPPQRPGRKRRATEQPISNVVFMGMGEPFDNLTNVLRAIGLLCEQHAFDFAPSRVTVSTVGVADKFEAFFNGTRAELAVSINAPDDERRSAIMPINERFGMRHLRDELLRTMPEGRRVLFQYALFAGFNDALDDASMLAEWVAPIPCRVNVIPANPGPDPDLVAPSSERVDAFVERLQQRGVTALVRRPRGRDVGGACGQLAGSRRLVQLQSGR